MYAFLGGGSSSGGGFSSNTNNNNSSGNTRKDKKKDKNNKVNDSKAWNWIQLWRFESILRLYYINKFYIAKKIISKMQVFINKFFPGI